MAGNPTTARTGVVEHEGAHEIVLSLPARPEFLRLARLTAADVGSRCGLGYEEVDDLRIAVDELCHAIMGPPAIESSTEPRVLELRFTLQADSLVIEGVCPSSARPELNELSLAILSAVVDEHHLTQGADGAGGFRMVKRVNVR